MSHHVIEGDVHPCWPMQEVAPFLAGLTNCTDGDCDADCWEMSSNVKQCYDHWIKASFILLPFWSDSSSCACRDSWICKPGISDE